MTADSDRGYHDGTWHYISALADDCEACNLHQAGPLALAAQDAVSLIAPGESFSAESTRGLSTHGSQRTGTATSSLVDTPKLGGAKQPASSRFGRQTPDPTPGSSPRGPSDFQDVGMSLQRSSRNDLRAIRCVPGAESYGWPMLAAFMLPDYKIALQARLGLRPSDPSCWHLLCCWLQVVNSIMCVSARDAGVVLSRITPHCGHNVERCHKRLIMPPCD